MSYIDDLVLAYREYVSLPWQDDLAAPQRVWMAIYPPDQERRLRLHVEDFAVATQEAGHPWGLIDITDSFERWMAGHEYRDEYFEDPDLLVPALPAFLDVLVEDVAGQLRDKSTPDSVIGLLGGGALFGLGEEVKVSALVNAVNDAILGRLLVFFPGEHEGNSYRLLDARDGWNYLATPITPSGSGS